LRVVGYSDKLSAAAGDEITFMVSSQAERYSASLVRLIHGDIDPRGPGFKSAPVDASFAGEYDGEEYPINLGSYIRVPADERLVPTGGLTVAMWVFPTTPERGEQTLISARVPGGGGYALRLVGGRPTFEVGEGSITLDKQLLPRIWYFLAATHDPRSGEARIVLEATSGVTIDAGGTASGTISAAPGGVAEVLIAADAPREPAARASGFYNGKIDAPAIWGRALGDSELAASRAGTRADGAIAAWDFSHGIDTWAITDTSGNGHHGAAVNMPMRAATGHNWTGRQTAWTEMPDQYGAIHFHDDDLGDAEWPAAFTWTIPEGLRSGVYAVQLDAGDEQDLVAFVVTPRRGKPTAPIALILPTFSYLAYGNERMLAPGSMFETMYHGTGAPAYPFQAEDAYIVETGMRSLYDHHSDGSGVCYATWLRPLVNMRPKYHYPYMDNGHGAAHQLPADLHIVDWLEHEGYEFDVFTDLELHDGGAERLRDYQVILTGSHCEYWSFEMITGAERYLQGGGRMMYLGGNGMYWIVGFDPNTRAGIELRRRGPADQTWMTEPGEALMGVSGELGGLWRYRGHSPQSWLGVGFSATGHAPGAAYERRPDSFDPRVGFVFDGVEGNVIGDFPSLVNTWGAAGHEVDRFDPELGSPAHTLVLASTIDLKAGGWALPNEENVNGQDPAAQLDPRGDIVLLTYPEDGAVFSTGTVAWGACLSYNGYRNDVARITRNVLDRFIADGPVTQG
jgi:N,N-dimethylformamidase